MIFNFESWAEGAGAVWNSKQMMLTAKCSETSHYLIRELLPTTRPVTDTALLPKECHMNNKSQEF